ncbi:GM22653 [Drosophila sechellia]|uniref:GM22653 n=1 Tax=Drosophila sechellia TaxID=7238 RepID=B4IPB2_DROSE|nr:GM22653 [Drosophila sechellia]
MTSQCLIHATISGVPSLTFDAVQHCWPLLLALRSETIVRPSAVPCNCNYAKTGCICVCGCASAGHENYAKQWRLNAQRPGQKKQTPLALNLALNLNLKPKWELFENSRSLEEEDALHIAYATAGKGEVPDLSGACSWQLLAAAHKL